VVIPPLNVKQKRVAFGAVAVFILMFLCPPWNVKSQSQMYHEDSGLWNIRTRAMGLPLFHESFDGYHWLFNAPRGGSDYYEEGFATHKGTSYGYHIAWGILFLQWLLVSLVALALVHRYRDKNQVTPETMTTSTADKPNQGETPSFDVSPELMASKSESELPVEKDIIPAKQVNTTIIRVVGLVIFIIIVLGIIVYTQNQYNTVSYTTPIPAPVASHLSPSPTATGIAFMEKGDYQQAITEFNKLIKLNPLDHAAYNSRGEAYLKLGKFKQAKEDFNRAIIAFNKSGDRGRSYLIEKFKWKSYDQLGPLSDLTAAAEKVVDESKYYRNRGLAYEKLGKKKQAIEDMKTAAKLGDKDAQKYLLSKEMAW
jgi:tetratricopeptide (TPR) repeat protein